MLDNLSPKCLLVGTSVFLGPLVLLWVILQLLPQELISRLLGSGGPSTLGLIFLIYVLAVGPFSAGYTSSRCATEIPKTHGVFAAVFGTFILTFYGAPWSPVGTLIYLVLSALFGYAGTAMWTADIDK